MVTLLIEHAISDYDTWRTAFDRFATTRRDAGVRAERIARPVDDPAYVVVTLDFDTADRAEGFRQFLTTRIWADPASSPALAGSPRATVLTIQSEVAAAGRCG